MRCRNFRRSVQKRRNFRSEFVVGVGTSVTSVQKCRNFRSELFVRRKKFGHRSLVTDSIRNCHGDRMGANYNDGLVLTCSMVLSVVLYSLGHHRLQLRPRWGTPRASHRHMPSPPRDITREQRHLICRPHPLGTSPGSSVRPRMCVCYS